MKIHNTAFLQMSKFRDSFLDIINLNKGHVIPCPCEKKKIPGYLEACLVHDLVVPDDLDGHLLVTSRTVPGPEYK
jgi:hypothetical protein